MQILLKDIEVQNPFKPSYFSDVLIENGRILEITRNMVVPDAKEISGENKIITPGLIDRHTHGGFGCNFNTCSEDELQTYLIKCQEHGIKSVLPTIMTDSIENINRQISLIKNVKSKGAKILGIHLEGPFINPVKKGIHPENHILPPTIENLNKIDTEFIKVLTYAPELDKDDSFLKELLNRGIVASVGHTDASYETGVKAFQDGATSLTHLFNAMRPIHHREPSVITAALHNDDVYLEIIADLEHVHRAIIENAIVLKPKNKIVLISDALPISYSDAREAIFGEEKIYYDGHRAASKEGTLAGSTLFFDDIYKKVSDFITFRDFLGYITKNVMESLNMEALCKVEKGSDDFIIWDKENFKILSVN